MKRNLAVAIVFLLASATARAAPFAMITELKGEAWALEGAQPQKLALLGYIEKPTEVRVDPAGRLGITYFTDGVQYSFVGPVRLALQSPTPKVIEGQQGEARKVVPDKGIKGGLSPEQWRRLQQATVVMRSVRPSFTVIGPDKTTLLAREPQFEWTTLAGVNSYRLVVYGPDNAVLHEAITTQNAMQPGGSLVLQPGQRYRWKVDAIGVSRPQSTSGTFTIAPALVSKEMAELRAAAGNDAAARAFYATALEAQGFAHDARSEWKALARDYPNEPEFQQRAR